MWRRRWLKKSIQRPLPSMLMRMCCSFRIPVKTSLVNDNYFAAGLRGGFLHLVLTVLPYTITAMFIPVFYYDGAILALLIINALHQHYLHSNLRVPAARWIEKALVTPRMHLIHHHAEPRWTNSNYGFLFSVWDRWLGTFSNPDAVGRDEPLGLNYPASRWKVLLGLPAGIEPLGHDASVRQD